ncbi:Protein C45E1.4 [Aphelenchoides avenae]|nr:Protein C45E1.4 [Aphelenchus avenae]
MWSSRTVVLSLLLGIATVSSEPQETSQLTDASSTVNARHPEDVDEGNGFENEGIGGHHGLFRAFVWSPEELRSISLWHATAQYPNVVELVKEKLDSSSIHPIARRKVEAFIAKHRPPQSVQTLLNKSQRAQVRHFHLTKDVEGVLDVISTRLSQLSPAARKEVLDYLSLPHRHE